MTGTEIQTLYALLAEQERNLATDQGLTQNLQQSESDLHYQILRGNGNPKVLSVLEGGLYQQIRLYRYQFSASNQQPYQAFKEQKNE